MIEMLRIYSNGFLENVTIEELPPWPFIPLCQILHLVQNDKHGISLEGIRFLSPICNQQSEMYWISF